MIVVQADKHYLDGTLAGMTIPSGFTCTYPTMREAIRVVRWLRKVERDGDFIRATGTGERYRVSRVTSKTVAPL